MIFKIKKNPNKSDGKLCKLKIHSILEALANQKCS